MTLLWSRIDGLSVDESSDALRRYGALSRVTLWGPSEIFEYAFPWCRTDPNPFPRFRLFRWLP